MPPAYRRQPSITASTGHGAQLASPPPRYGTARRSFPSRAWRDVRSSGSSGCVRRAWGQRRPQEIMYRRRARHCSAGGGRSRLVLSLTKSSSQFAAGAAECSEVAKKYREGGLGVPLYAFALTDAPEECGDGVSKACVRHLVLDASARGTHDASVERRRRRRRRSGCSCMPRNWTGELVRLFARCSQAVVSSSLSASDC